MKNFKSITRNQLFLVLLLVFNGSFNSFGQDFVLRCQDVVNVVSLEELNDISFTMRMEDSPGPQPTPLCPDGGGAHNMSWLGFVAEEGSYEIRISPESCVNPSDTTMGVQIGVYEDCTFSSFVYCDPTCVTNTITLSSNLFDPGSTYYIFVDGCFGTFCDVNIDVVEKSSLCK